MRLSIPTLPAVMLALFAIWQIVAGLGTLIPGFVHDRHPNQFVPIASWMVQVLGVDDPSPGLLGTIGHVFQWIIGPTELLIGATAMAAVFARGRRLALANFSLGLALGLFGAFLLTMFIMHDKSLPAWNQYPAICAWIGVTWLVVVSWERGWAVGGRPSAGAVTER